MRGSRRRPEQGPICDRRFRPAILSDTMSRSRYQPARAAPRQGNISRPLCNIREMIMGVGWPAALSCLVRPGMAARHVLVLKTAMARKRHRGFESHALRSRVRRSSETAAQTAFRVRFRVTPSVWPCPTMHGRHRLAVQHACNGPVSGPAMPGKGGATKSLRERCNSAKVESASNLGGWVRNCRGAARRRCREPETPPRLGRPSSQ